MGSKWKFLSQRDLDVSTELQTLDILFTKVR